MKDDDAIRITTLSSVILASTDSLEHHGVWNPRGRNSALHLNGLIG